MTGLCECGCGGETRLAPRSHLRWGWIKGRPLRFIRGHNGRRLLRDGPNASDEARFWLKVDRSGGPGACWPWLGPTSGKKQLYGRFFYLGREEQAHVMAWFFTYGSFPKHFGCHRCDVSLCVNPTHLFDGTQRENIIDSRNKDRWGGSKLTVADVVQIRMKLRAGMPQRVIAREY